ncbi:DJ-1/PfpI family protein [bacterium]|nr:DJ-1/PfpI family protein [bacterium]
MANEKTKQALMIIAHKDFRDEEFQEPKAILEKNGIKVTVASSGADFAKGVLGLRYKPDITLSEVKAGDYCMVVFVGGAGSKEYWMDETAHKIAREAVSSGKVLGAICIAPVILLNAGLLEGKMATVFHSEAKTLINGGANYTGKEVERDGLIITSSGPGAAKDFGFALVEALTGQSKP